MQGSRLYGAFGPLEHKDSRPLAHKTTHHVNTDTRLAKNKYPPPPLSPTKKNHTPKTNKNQAIRHPLATSGVSYRQTPALTASEDPSLEHKTSVLKNLTQWSTSQWVLISPHHVTTWSQHFTSREGKLQLIHKHTENKPCACTPFSCFR